MAWENTGPYITILPTTGLRQFRFVKVNTSGLLAYPSASSVGTGITGVLVSNGTTGSTVDPVKGATVQIYGVAKVEAKSSTVAVGDWITASSAGQVDSSSNAGDVVVGQVVAGTSGGANRMLSVLLKMGGSTILIT